MSHNYYCLSCDKRGTECRCKDARKSEIAEAQMASPIVVPAVEDSPNRVDLEGELTAQLWNSVYALLLDEASLVELLVYKFKVQRGDKEKRSFGRVRVTVELIEE